MLTNYPDMCLDDLLIWMQTLRACRAAFLSISPARRLPLLDVIGDKVKTSSKHLDRSLHSMLTNYPATCCLDDLLIWMQTLCTHVQLSSVTFRRADRFLVRCDRR